MAMDKSQGNFRVGSDNSQLHRINFRCHPLCMRLHRSLWQEFTREQGVWRIICTVLDVAKSSRLDCVVLVTP